MKYLALMFIIIVGFSTSFATYMNYLSFENAKDIFSVIFILLILGPIMSVFIRSKDLKGFYTMLVGYIGLAFIIVVL